MKTIEELFVSEYENQRKTIDDLRLTIDLMDQRFKDLINEIKSLKLQHDEKEKHVFSYAWNIQDAHERLPTLTEYGCIEFLKEN